MAAASVMSPERLLVAGAAVVLTASLVAAAAVPGAVAPPETGPEGPGRLDVRELAVAPGAVGGRTAELRVEARLAHRGPTARNVTVEFRAVDAESGLLEAETAVAVAPIEGEREASVNATLRVAREGGYRLTAVVYHEGRRLEAASREVANVDALRPAYADSPVAFHRFRETDQPAVEYAVAGTDGDAVDLAVTTYLTNAGDAEAGGLRLVVKARQADSGIVADAAEVGVGRIRPGRTATPTATLTVPDGYNYYLDAQLWVDGVLVGSARSAANLDPTETLSVNRTRRDVDLEVGDFEREPGAVREATGAPARTATPGQPGFGAAVAALAVLAAALLARRRHTE